MKNMPRITVLMPVHNGERYLKNCIESILNQTFKDFEFLVVDDGSTDTTRDIINSYKDDRINLVKNERNLGLVASLNIGLENSRGEYIARIDADDIALPHRLTRQFDFLENRHDTALIGSWGEAIKENGDRISISRLPVKKEEIAATVLFGEFIMIHSSFMYRKKIIVDAGKYSKVFYLCEDYKLVTDLLLSGYGVNNIPEVLVKYRIHDDRISVRNSGPQLKMYLIVVKEFIQNFTGGFSDLDQNLLFNFLISTGAMNKRYWENVPSVKGSVRRIIELSNSLLANIANYFKLDKGQTYRMKRQFYNKILNFAYQASCIKRYASLELYLWCLRNSLFVLTKPKVYAYPLAVAFSCLKKR